MNRQALGGVHLSWVHSQNFQNEFKKPHNLVHIFMDFRKKSHFFPGLRVLLALMTQFFIQKFNWLPIKNKPKYCTSVQTSIIFVWSAHLQALVS